MRFLLLSPSFPLIPNARGALLFCCFSGAENQLSKRTIDSPPTYSGLSGKTFDCGLMTAVEAVGNGNQATRRQDGLHGLEQLDHTRFRTQHRATGKTVGRDYVENPIGWGKTHIGGDE